ncbi:hypothetical protein AB3S75_012768 [Citrus x aurantiifolia]
MKARAGYICADMVLIWPFQLHIPRQQESSSARFLVSSYTSVASVSIHVFFSLSKKGYKCFLSSSPSTDTPLKSLRPFNEVLTRYAKAPSKSFSDNLMLRSLASFSLRGKILNKENSQLKRVNDLPHY